MNILSQQPKSLVLAVALALGATVLAAGCSSQNNGTNGVANKSAMQNGGAHGGMAAGTGNSSQPVTDTWITTKVKTAFATMQGVNNSNIHVETNNGVVTLTGTASSQASVNAMANAAKHVKGVTEVDTSGLRVGSAAASSSSSDSHVQAGVGNSTQPVSDTWITTKVLAALQTVNGLNNSGIGVETNNGVVALTGHVKSQSMLDKAVKEIKTVNGVKSVDTSRVKIGSSGNQ